GTRSLAEVARSRIARPRRRRTVLTGPGSTRGEGNPDELLISQREEFARLGRENARLKVIRPRLDQEPERRNTSLGSGSIHSSSKIRWSPRLKGDSRTPPTKERLWL